MGEKPFEGFAPAAATANLHSIRQKTHLTCLRCNPGARPFSTNSSIQEQDFLFNLAGQTSHMDSMDDPYTDLEINCRAQISILEARRKYNPEIKVVFASTRQIYGKPDSLPVNEDHLLRPGGQHIHENGFTILYAEHCLHQHLMPLARGFGIERVTENRLRWTQP